MENAVQALIMAGVILIGIMILSIGAVIYVTHSDTAEAINAKWNLTEIIQYNSSFLIYEGRTEVTAQDIVSLVSLAQQRQSEIVVFVKTTTGTEKGKNNLTLWDSEKLNQFLSDHIVTTVKDEFGNSKQINTFSYVKHSIDENTGKIVEIEFQEN